VICQKRPYRTAPVRRRLVVRPGVSAWGVGDIERQATTQHKHAHYQTNNRQRRIVQIRLLDHSLVSFFVYYLLLAPIVPFIVPLLLLFIGHQGRFPVQIRRTFVGERTGQMPGKMRLVPAIGSHWAYCTYGLTVGPKSIGLGVWVSG